MCIGYLELNQWKTLIIWLRVNGLLFSLFNILDHLFIFANLLEKSFQKNFLQIVKGIGIRLQEAFLRFEISPLFQMLFLWLNKSSPWINYPLSFQEGFEDLKNSFEISNERPIEKFTSHTYWKFILIKYQLKYLFVKIWNGGGAVLLLWANTFSPFGINSQKQRTWEPFILSPHW
jgi:hypothetical protein